MNLPQWYLDIPEEVPQPILNDKHTATPAEVCIKNVIPECKNMDEYEDVCFRSVIRNCLC